MSALSKLWSKRTGAGVDEDPPFHLSTQQEAFFRTFGFVTLRGLFRPEIERIRRGFEEVFTDNTSWDTNEDLHFNERRRIIPAFVERSADLAWLPSDPRVVEVVTRLIGPEYEYAASDGNLFDCDTSWHPDSYQSPLHVFHVKLSFYLDALKGGTGAIRMIPGTNFFNSEFALEVRRNTDDPKRIEEIYGVQPDAIPSWTLDSEPGDVIVWAFRTVHASFNGGERRRLFSLNFREKVPAS
jgi:ectoine hydroxylase-related dioxygenase (phytanoyl-CoA dioxygenase family)